MQNRITTLHGLLDAVGVANIAREDFELTLYIIRTLIQPTPGIPGVVESEGANLVTPANQLFGQMRADEAICTSDEDGWFFWLRIHLPILLFDQVFITADPLDSPITQFHNMCAVFKSCQPMRNNENSEFLTQVFDNLHHGAFGVII